MGLLNVDAQIKLRTKSMREICDEVLSSKMDKRIGKHALVDLARLI